MTDILTEIDQDVETQVDLTPSEIVNESLTHALAISFRDYKHSLSSRITHESIEHWTHRATKSRCLPLSAHAAFYQWSRGNIETEYPLFKNIFLLVSHVIRNNNDASSGLYKTAIESEESFMKIKNVPNFTYSFNWMRHAIVVAETSTGMVFSASPANSLYGYQNKTNRNLIKEVNTSASIQTLLDNDISQREGSVWPSFDYVTRLIQRNVNLIPKGVSKLSGSYYSEQKSVINTLDRDRILFWSGRIQLAANNFRERFGLHDIKMIGIPMIVRLVNLVNSKDTTFLDYYPLYLVDENQ